MTPRAPPPIVLDTNVVLDWLHFTDPACAWLEEAIPAGRLMWTVAPGMREEFASVLQRGLRGLSPCSAPALLERWDAMARASDAPVASVLWRCRDPDDQIFLDLSLAIGARWLVTRDRDLLVLARRARAHGLHIMTPLQGRIAVEAALGLRSG